MRTTTIRIVKEFLEGPLKDMQIACKFRTQSPEVYREACVLGESRKDLVTGNFYRIIEVEEGVA